MPDQLQWKVSRDGTSTHVALSGPLNETSELLALVAELDACAKLSFDLGAVTRINSCGVRDWLEFVGKLPEAETRFENCSATFVRHLNLIRGFGGRATIASISVPFACDACSYADTAKLAVARGRMPELPARACAKCKQPMQLDDLAETFFAFLLR